QAGATAVNVHIGPGWALGDLAREIGMRTVDPGVDHRDHDAGARGLFVHIGQRERANLPLQAADVIGLGRPRPSRRSDRHSQQTSHYGRDNNDRAHARRIAPHCQGTKTTAAAISRPTSATISTMAISRAADSTNTTLPVAS